uniref:Uncharacterized protein n=1 Tax=Biomphalaria glabrata TaxID=6526 RepID=A0A2C9LXI1_BIOGL
MRLVLSFVLVWAIAYAKPSARKLNLARLTRNLNKIDFSDCGQRPLATDNGASEVANITDDVQEAIPHSHPSICSIRRSHDPNHHACSGVLVKKMAGEYHIFTSYMCIWYSTYYNIQRYEAYCGVHKISNLGEPQRVRVTFRGFSLYK